MNDRAEDGSRRWVGRARVLWLVICLVALSAIAGAAPRATQEAYAIDVKATTIYYHTTASARPEVLVETRGAWSKQPRTMAAVGNRPGWWRATVASGASSLVFRHPEHDEWIHPHEHQNFINEHGATELFVKDRRLTYAPPERAQVEHVVAPEHAGSGRALTVILPPGYDAAAQRRYPVLYLFDGQSLLDHPIHRGGWAAQDALTKVAQSGTAEPMIIVGIHAAQGEARKDEYSPTRDETRGFGGGTPKLLSYMVNELVPYIDGRYQTRTRAADRAIGGASLGALAAMHALLERPDVFSPGLIYSPAVWVANKAILDDVRRSSTLLSHRLVLYHGGPADEDANARELHRELMRKGMVDQLSLFYAQDPHGLHDEIAWRNFLEYGLSILFPAR